MQADDLYVIIICLKTLLVRKVIVSNDCVSISVKAHLVLLNVLALGKPCKIWQEIYWKILKNFI